MKVFLVLILALASAAAEYEIPVHPRDLPAVTASEGRITNGYAAKDGQFPYQAALTFNSWTCGGSLIGDQWILTAAHCTKGATTVTAYLGSARRSAPTLTVTSRTFITHSSYSSTTLNNDIALISISRISFTSLINKIALPPMGTTSTYQGVRAVASGFGLVSDSATSISQTLNYAYLDVISNSVCSQYYGSSTINANVICTATPNGVSTCSGDSGGPLATTTGTPLLIGVTSFVSSRGCTSGAPAGFERVTGHLTWIKSNTGISY